MFRSELSTFLLCVLDAVASRTAGVPIDGVGEPASAVVDELARELREESDDVRSALIGLHAGHCLMEESVEFPGVEPIVRLVAHPQCLKDDTTTEPTLPSLRPSL